MSGREKIAIIGSNSFSGASFAAFALCSGFDVLGISRSREPADAFLPYKWEGCKKSGSSFRFLKLDLNRDAEKIAKAIQDFHAPYVFNFASQSMVAQSWERPLDWYQTNVIGNVKLHDLLRKLDSLKKYIHISTPEVYGNCSGTITEQAAFNPSTPYAVSRAACDMHLLSFWKQYKFPVVFTRAANVYGPGQQLYRIIPRAMLFIKLGKKLQLHGGGRSVRSFIHIRDVAKATLDIALKGRPGEAYHISTDRFISIKELTEMICSGLGADFNELVEVADERPGKDNAYLLDCSKLRNETGWEPEISLEAGLKETAQWVTSSLEALKKQPFDYIHKP